MQVDKGVLIFQLTCWGCWAEFCRLFGDPCELSGWAGRPPALSAHHSQYRQPARRRESKVRASCCIYGYGFDLLVLTAHSPTAFSFLVPPGFSGDPSKLQAPAYHQHRGLSCASDHLAHLTLSQLLCKRSPHAFSMSQQWHGTMIHYPVPQASHEEVSASISLKSAGLVATTVPRRS